MKLLMIGISVGLVLGVLLTVIYLSLAAFFAVDAKARNTSQKVTDNSHGRGEDTMLEQKMKAQVGK
jgi:hypothetical protein